MVWNDTGVVFPSISAGMSPRIIWTANKEHKKVRRITKKIKLDRPETLPNTFAYSLVRTDGVT
jgi:hypothetical protein